MEMSNYEKNCWDSLDKPIQVKKYLGSLTALDIRLVDQRIRVNRAQDLRVVREG